MEAMLGVKVVMALVVDGETCGVAKGGDVRHLIAIIAARPPSSAPTKRLPSLLTRHDRWTYQYGSLVH